LSETQKLLHDKSILHDEAKQFDSVDIMEVAKKNISTKIVFKMFL
jgi:hypothetical protein